MKGCFLSLTVITLLFVFSACSTQHSVYPIYRWGEYEDLIYEMYTEPGQANLDTQVVKLTADVERTLAEGKLVPPGVHAHLGYLYFLQGNTGAAMNEFAAEKERFPESTVFIDGIVKRLRGIERKL